ncbi:MAG: isoaspartyl peptidase/L-asparaginase [Candidatus Heimdallarchaeota archaeon]|nr:isoaspartyl peptidase/L-asparaginase [Candidatus Heimdallarchaeota archaeon]
MTYKPILVIHAGAGTVPQELRDSARSGVLIAIKEAWDLLINGSTAVDAVEKAVELMENYHQFNAGYGSVLTEKGTIEMDAMIMDGSNRNVGGVIAVSRVKNPIILSRKVMDNSPHVLFTSEGAEQFAIEQGIDLIDPNQLITERSKQRLERFREKEGGYGSYIQSGDPERRDKYGTVGAVAMDAEGRFAAATSTGGVLGKKIGRVGDTPIIGAGTYADDMMAFSGTGVGEYIIRSVLGMEVKLQLSIHPEPQKASNAALEVMKDTIGGEAGLILVTRDGWAAAKTTKDLIFAAKTVDSEDFIDFSQYE